MRFSLGKEIPEINCALSEISHVILSLIVNAYDSIVDSAKHGQKGTITIRSSACSAGIKIEVRDNGGGIPDAIRDRIFEPFFTTKPVGQGMGQGLALAHAVIALEHGGKLVFETASKALSHVVKKEKMTSATAKPTTTSTPTIIQFIKSIVSLAVNYCVINKKVLVG